MIHLIAVYDIEAGGFKIEPRMIEDKDLHLYPRVSFIRNWYFREEVAKRIDQGRRVLPQTVHYQRTGSPLNWTWRAIPVTDLDHFSAETILADFRKQITHPVKLSKMKKLFEREDL